jgi:hypothetical protein
MIKLGQKVRDAITGFEGIATAKVEYINGCVQFGIQPQATDGKMPESVYLDHQRLVAVGDGPALPSSDTGGAMRDAPPASYRG